MYKVSVFKFLLGGGFELQRNDRPPAGCANVCKLATQTSHLGTDICTPIIPGSNLGPHLGFSFVFTVNHAIKFFKYTKFVIVRAATVQIAPLYQVILRTVVAICLSFRATYCLDP